MSAMVRHPPREQTSGRAASCGTGQNGLVLARLRPLGPVPERAGPFWCRHRVFDRFLVGTIQDMREFQAQPGGQTQALLARPETIVTRGLVGEQFFRGRSDHFRGHLADDELTFPS